MSGKQGQNYVLCGYYSDVLMTLTGKYPFKILEYYISLEKILSRKLYLMLIKNFFKIFKNNEFYV